MTGEEALQTVLDHAHDQYEKKEQELGSERMRTLEQLVLLRVIDRLWIYHLTALEELRQGIGLVGYGQLDPLVEFKREAFDMFSQLNEHIRQNTVRQIYHTTFTAPPPPRPVVPGARESGPSRPGGRVTGALRTARQRNIRRAPETRSRVESVPRRGATPQPPRNSECGRFRRSRRVGTTRVHAKRQEVQEVPARGLAGSSDMHRHRPSTNTTDPERDVTPMQRDHLPQRSALAPAFALVLPLLDAVRKCLSLAETSARSYRYWSRRRFAAAVAERLLGEVRDLVPVAKSTRSLRPEAPARRHDSD